MLNFVSAIMAAVAIGGALLGLWWTALVSGFGLLLSLLYAVVRWVSRRKAVVVRSEEIVVRSDIVGGNVAVRRSPAAEEGPPEYPRYERKSTTQFSLGEEGAAYRGPSDGGGGGGGGGDSDAAEPKRVPLPEKVAGTSSLLRREDSEPVPKIVADEAADFAEASPPADKLGLMARERSDKKPARRNRWEFIQSPEQEQQQQQQQESVAYELADLEAEIRALEEEYAQAERALEEELLAEGQAIESNSEELLAQQEAKQQVDHDQAGGLKAWVDKYLGSLAEGQIVVDAAEGMLVEKKERVTVRISEQTREELIAELGEQTSHLRIESLEIAPVMRVTLDGPKFEIKPQGAADRVIRRNEIWAFDVTPLEKGSNELTVMVAVVLALPGYHSEMPSYVRTKTLTIKVTVSYKRKIGKWLEKNWTRAPIYLVITVIGGGVAAFYKIEAVKRYMIHLFNIVATSIGLPTIPE